MRLWKSTAGAYTKSLPGNFLPRCLCHLVYKKTELCALWCDNKFLLSGMRADLLLPEDCPYLNTIQKDLRDATARKREREDNEEEYDLTQRCYGRM